MPSLHLLKKSFLIKGHATSVALEQEFWNILLQVAEDQDKSLNALITSVDTDRDPEHPLTSALRLTALTHLTSKVEVKL